MQFNSMLLSFSFFLLLQSINFVINDENTEKSGPYKSTLLKSYKCEKPSKPYEKEPTFLFNTEIYNTTTSTNLLRGNVTITKENTNLKIKSKGYLLKDGKWKIHYLYNSVDCKGFMMSLIWSTLGIEYNSKKCSLPKGTHTFSNIDLNQVDHTWLLTKEYGQTLWRVEVFSETYTIICWEFHSFVTPL